MMNSESPASRRTCSLAAPSMDAFLNEHAALILRLARAFVRGGRDGVEAADVAHEVVASLLNQFRAGAFDPARVENTEAYLRIVVRHAALRAATRRKRVERTVDDADLAGIAEEAGRLVPQSVRNPEETTQRAMDGRRRLDALKAKLRPRDALAFALLVEEGLAIEEVALSLGTTTNNVYQMRHRILAASRELPASERTPSLHPEGVS